MKKVIVACGTGVAISTAVCVKIEEALKKANVQAEIVQCRAADIDSNLSGASLVVTTTSYTNDKVPVIRALSFLTGVGVEQDIKKIIDILS